LEPRHLRTDPARALRCPLRASDHARWGGIPADVYADFIREFTPQERIEVAIVATSMGMLNKLNDALRVPLESEFEALVA
jgi:hypothetical protein